MIKISVIIDGPDESTVDELINGGREVIARNGFQVGNFDYDVELVPGRIVGDMEVESADIIGDDGLVWGDFAVTNAGW